MWRGYVESDSGELLRIIRPDGTFGGKAILAFLTSFSKYRHHVVEDEDRPVETLAWFDELNNLAEKALRDKLAPLENAYYAGDWGDYALDEWEFFIRRNKININQWQFEQALASVHEKWTLINKLRHSVTYLLQILETNEIKPANWYYPDDTIPEFQGLEQSLYILKERHTKLVRIKFV